MELAFQERSLREFGSWKTYLESIGCHHADSGLPWPEHPRRDECEIIHDPSPFGGVILVPNELSLKILTLGLP